MSEWKMKVFFKNFFEAESNCSRKEKFDSLNFWEILPLKAGLHGGGWWVNECKKLLSCFSESGRSGKSNSGKNARGMENYLLSAETYPKICETKVVQNIEREGVVEQMPRLLQEAKPSPLGPTLVPPWSHLGSKPTTFPNFCWHTAVCSLNVSLYYILW